MRFKRVIILTVAMLLLLPLWGAAQKQPLRVAVLPFAVHSTEDLSYLRDWIWDIISSRIIVEGEIETVEKPLVVRFLSDLRGTEISDQEARWLGARVGANYVVYGSITKAGEYISLDAKVVQVAGTRPTTSVFAQHKGIDEVMTKVDTFAQDIGSRVLGHGASYEHRGPLQGRQYMTFQSLGYSKLLGFPKRNLKGVDAGDVDGDGKNEIVVMDESKLWVYRDEGKEIKLVAELQTSSSHNFLTLDVIDITGDKRAEICVTNAIGDSLSSFILDYENGSFRYLAKGLGWYLRVVKIPDKGDCLLAQLMGTNKDYDGAIRLVQWTGKKVKMGQKLKKGKKGQLPNGVEGLLDFTSGKFTSPETQEFLVIDESGKLRMLDATGDLQWKSSDDVGGSDNYVDRPTVYADKRGAPTSTASPRRIYFPPRMVAKDLDGDGIDDLVAVVNKFTVGELLSKVRIYDKGYVTGLSWDGMTLANVWRTQ
ncbi:MAG: FG-GAP-like repeat-containing protein, partial [Desulfobacterales bacterium]|nr:FG-GAP-like repeat-containing protein [Desulfobacterales bacterium]